MSELPLISVIMPTRNRRQFIPQAIQYFLRQDYANTELIIIDDGDEAIEDLIPLHENIRYVEISERLSIGMKRNIACSLATGEIICHGDDDDIFFPSRLSKQARPILEGKADVTALKMSLLLRTCDMTLWRCSDAVHKALFSLDVKCGTMMFRASYLNDLHYPNTSRGEDHHFMHMLLRCGARLERVIDPTSYICVRHGDNVTDDIDGMEQPGWEQVPIEQYLSGEDRAFYEGLREGVARV